MTTTLPDGRNVATTMSGSTVYVQEMKPAERIDVSFTITKDGALLVHEKPATTGPVQLEFDFDGKK